ncbi:porin [Piscinibacter koreensis]|uniref:Porin n=1 Tax=Piscinibacter koreensis TaxID=2742824 RepID=A0A7Y6NRN0_9BURK|nr:porin [Schlegelella koreensis]NUZ08097.1 porin [Schlegelella koreensis]
MRHSTINARARPRSCRALALAATLPLGAAVEAQSSVTIGGIADAAARHVRNTGGGSMKSLASGSNGTSRIIIRGAEDLGDGLSAGFHLEHGLLLDSGSQASTSQFWDRRSTIGLTGRTWGEVRMGRDFVPSYVNWSRYDPFSYVGVAGSNNLVSAGPAGPIRSAFSTSPNTTVRSSNAVQWLLPSGWAGLDGGLMLAAGEGGIAANGLHKVSAARLGWGNRRFGVSVAITRSENNLTAGGTFRDRVVGGQADLGFVRLSAAYRIFDVAAAEQRNLLVGAIVPLGQGELKLSWNRADLAGRVGNASIAANDAEQFGIGYVYFLSKRTALYGTAARIDNKGAATFVVPAGPAIAPGGKSTGVEAGIRHSF